MKPIFIGKKKINYGERSFIIAEAGVNHNGSLDLALKLVDAAAKAGADAVKFQTFKAERLVTAVGEMAEYQKKNLKKSGSQLAMLKKLELKEEFYPKLIKRAEDRGIIFLSSPFSESDADFLEKLKVSAYKIGSGEITNLPFLKYVAKKGKPMIVSTGMSDLEEVEEAVKAILKAGNKKIILLHCTSNYPPSYESLNLNAITTLRNAFKNWNILVGYSDNGSKGVLAEIAAAALGVCVIEKHLTLDKNMGGPDHKASLNPEEFKCMVAAIRDTEKILGSFEKYCTPEEEPIKLIARKSIVAAAGIKKGERFTLDNLTIKRPGTGLEPVKLEFLLKKVAAQDIEPDTVLDNEHFV